MRISRLSQSFLIWMFLAAVTVSGFASGATEDDTEGTPGAGPGGFTITDARGESIEVTDASRVVTLGSAVTEIVFALDEGERVVGVDSSSRFPLEGLEDVPRTGYVRDLSAEGVISLGPSLVIGTVDVGPPEVVRQLEDAGVPVFILPEEDSFSGAIERVRLVGELLGANEAAAELVSEIERDVERAQTIAQALPASDRETVLFVYARGVGSVSVSGTGTSAHAIIELAGGENAVSEFEGYRPLTAESAVSINPDVLLFMDSGLASIGGRHGLADVPGISQTAAFENDRILSFEGTYLLGFGPRVGRAALELAQELYPDAEVSP
jgi:iron complex transport system substrate-binding protein